MVKNRWAHYLILVCAMVLLSFFFPRLMPGSPIARLAGGEAGDLTFVQRERILESYDLDKPLGEQFLIFLKNTVTLNWGKSFSKKQPIFDLLKSAIPWTLLLALSNLILSSIIGTVIGALSAFLRKKRKDIKLVLALMLLGAFPSFWIGMILISIFSVQLKWFPLYGAYSLWENKEGFAYLLDVAKHLTLPVITAVITSFSIFFTASRYSVLSVLKQDYINMATVRGLPGWKVKTAYVMRNSLIPVFTVFMTELGFILSGSIVIERLFSYPGIGLLLYDAVSARDYPLMQYVFMITSVMVISTTFLTDFFARKIDPAMEIAYEE